MEGIIRTAPMPGPPPPLPLVFMKSIPWPSAAITLPLLSGGTAWAMNAGAPEMRKELTTVMATNSATASQNPLL